MSSESTATHGLPADEAPREVEEPAFRSQPWVTRLCAVACIAIYLGLLNQNDYESWETIARYGYLPPTAIWEGSWWALITSAFVHFALWHLALNLYWLWILGTRLEQAIGSMRFLFFVLVSAFVSSSFQLAVSDDTGIGASGVVYAIFGFMWPTRRNYPHFGEVLDRRTVELFTSWLLLCVAATYLDLWQVGNAAHISGLLFGGAVAGTFVVRGPRLLPTGLTALLVLSIIPLTWCPWSNEWLGHKAYAAHVSERFDLALEHYSRLIQRDPENAWAYLNRGMVYESLGEMDHAYEDFRRASQLDPEMMTWEADDR